MEYFKAVHGEELGETANRVIAQVLVIDRIVLQPIKQRNKIVGLRNEYALGG